MAGFGLRMMSREKLSEVERALKRRPPTEVALEGTPARAAVAVLIHPREDDLHVFFIHRAVDEGDPWSGHMGFPGGFREETDSDLLATVFREVHEEVGIDLAKAARLIGRLDEIQGVARGRQLPLVISPFLFAIEGPVDVQTNEEVQDVLWVPLSYFQDSRNETVIEYQVESQPMRLPAFVYRDRTIWGLTFRMLRDFLDVISGRSR